MLSTHVKITRLVRSCVELTFANKKEALEERSTSRLSAKPHTLSLTYLRNVCTRTK